MTQNRDSSGLTAQQEALILALLDSRTKSEAARKAGVAHKTMYRWFRNPVFMAAWRAAQRGLFDDGLATLARLFNRATLSLGDQLDTAQGNLLCTVATRIIDRTFKAQETINFEQELAHLRATLAALQAGQMPPANAEAPERNDAMTEQEQTEACRLRVVWMGELGNSAQDIADSLRYNRPQSVAEEQEFLHEARKHLEAERTCAGASG